MNDGGRLILPAPAKLNLFLHVTGRRQDGYHTLQTIFQLLDWSDEISLTIRDDGRIERFGGLAGLPADHDLTVRAARLLQQETGCALGVDLVVDKRIPAGAGLGGGSSDAATVLVGLNVLWKLGMPLSALARLGLALGADVPVFVNGHSAFAEGVGETLTPLRLPEDWFVVVWPGIAVATAAVYQAPELTRNTTALTIADLPASATRNDLQPVAIRLCPLIGEVLTWLAEQGEGRMSGSGSSVFVRVADEGTARALAAQCPWPAWPVRGCVVSPLHRALGLTTAA